LNSHSIRTEFWRANIGNPIQDTPLPVALFLIDPMFHERRNGSDFIPRATNARTFSETHHGDCEIGELVVDAKCTGKPLVGDHQWPHSLGGETLGDNLLKLCPSCNRQKSSSVLYYPWSNEELPNWLVQMLNELNLAKI
jgi:5-methylcytosine-specific restriction endonuclease McrA